MKNPILNKDIYADPKNIEHDFDFPFWRDNKKLWALDVPTEEMSIKEFFWIFEFPFWEDEEGNLVVTPNEVIDNPDKFPIHRDKMKNADTSYPVDIMKNKEGRWLTLDGLHRVVKLYIEGKTIIKVRKIPPEIIHLTAMEE